MLLSSVHVLKIPCVCVDVELVALHGYESLRCSPDIMHTHAIFHKIISIQALAYVFIIIHQLWSIASTDTRIMRNELHPISIALKPEYTCMHVKKTTLHDVALRILALTCRQNKNSYCKKGVWSLCN